MAIKTDLTNYSHRKKSITQKGNGAAWTTSQPLRAEWADIKPTITPLEQTNGVISGKESPSECGFVETKKPMFKSYGMTCVLSSYSCHVLNESMCSTYVLHLYCS